MDGLRSYATLRETLLNPWIWLIAVCLGGDARAIMDACSVPQLSAPIIH